MRLLFLLLLLFNFPLDVLCLLKSFLFSFILFSAHLYYFSKLKFCLLINFPFLFFSSPLGLFDVALLFCGALTVSFYIGFVMIELIHFNVLHFYLNSSRIVLVHCTNLNSETPSCSYRVYAMSIWKASNFLIPITLYRLYILSHHEIDFFFEFKICVFSGKYVNLIPLELSKD